MTVGAGSVLAPEGIVRVPPPMVPAPDWLTMSALASGEEMSQRGRVRAHQRGPPGGAVREAEGEGRAGRDPAAPQRGRGVHRQAVAVAELHAQHVLPVVVHRVGGLAGPYTGRHAVPHIRRGQGACVADAVTRVSRAAARTDVRRYDMDTKLRSIDQLARDVTRSDLEITDGGIESIFVSGHGPAAEPFRGPHDPVPSRSRPLASGVCRFPWRGAACVDRPAPDRAGPGRARRQRPRARADFSWVRDGEAQRRRRADRPASCSIWSSGTRRRRSRSPGSGSTLVKTAATGAWLASEAWSLVWSPSVVLADPADLLALPALGAAWWAYRNPVPVRRAAVILLLPAAVLGVAATARSRRASPLLSRRRQVATGTRSCCPCAGSARRAEPPEASGRPSSGCPWCSSSRRRSGSSPSSAWPS